ncbi:MAG: FAD-binding protein [Dehalococcoidia bacterium]|jgi:flavin-dependent dehydrogenase|nr:MAG: FAD-binding protein [Dehalococcoidia bacterium]
MKYDLLVVGGGPGGMMSARTAARDGLRVLLVEKNMEITRIRRYCSRNMRLGPGAFKTNKLPTDIEINRANLTFEMDKGHTVIRLTNQPEDAAIDYHGVLGPCFNATSFSPSGNSWGEEENSLAITSFVIDKETLAKDLLDEAVKAGCQVRAGTRCDDIEEQAGGIRAKLVSGAGEDTIEASRVIVADGAFSQLVEKLGFNEGRPAGAPQLKFLAFILDGISSPYPEPRHISFLMPSIHKGNINLSHWPPGRYQLSCSTSVTSQVNLVDVLQKIMTDSPFAQFFKNSRVEERQACNMELRPQVKDTARGNVICLGDNTAYAETAMKGALGLGYVAAKASKMALEGKDANQHHNNYWQHSYNSFSTQYRAWGKMVNPIHRTLGDGEIDTLYGWISKNHYHGMINDILVDNRSQFQAELPEISAKLLATGERPARPAVH